MQPRGATINEGRVFLSNVSVVVRVHHLHNSNRRAGHFTATDRSTPNLSTPAAIPRVAAPPCTPHTLVLVANRAPHSGASAGAVLAALHRRPDLRSAFADAVGWDVQRELQRRKQDQRLTACGASGEMRFDCCSNFGNTSSVLVRKRSLWLGNTRALDN